MTRDDGPASIPRNLALQLLFRLTLLGFECSHSVPNVPRIRDVPASVIMGALADVFGLAVLSVIIILNVLPVCVVGSYYE